MGIKQSDKKIRTGLTDHPTKRVIPPVSYHAPRYRDEVFSGGKSIKLNVDS